MTRGFVDSRMLSGDTTSKGTIMRKSIVLAVLAVATWSGLARADDHHATVQPEALKWTAPAAYGSGALLAVIKGDPSKEGVYVGRLKAPKGYKIQAHTHPNDENVTVLSGTFRIGTGDKFDETKSETVKAGGYAYVAKGMSHYAFFPEETVIQLHGIGPQGITYVNPADDPRKK
jgi:quercetin dioxygenase-like cupin family protein